MLKHVDLVKYGFVSTEPHRWVGEASSFPPTQKGWPEQIETDLGNKLPFIRTAKKVDREGDIQYVRYDQANGVLVLIIYND